MLGRRDEAEDMQIVHRGEHVEVFAMAERDRIAFALAMRLEIEQQHRVAGGGQQARATEHRKAVRMHAMQEGDRPRTGSASDVPAVQQDPGAAAEHDIPRVHIRGRCADARRSGPAQQQRDDPTRRDQREPQHCDCEQPSSPSTDTHRVVQRSRLCGECPPHPFIRKPTDAARAWT